MFQWIKAARLKQVSQRKDAGDLDGAETILKRVLDRNPDDLAVMTQFAEIATARKDWEQAVERWEHVCDVSEQTQAPLPEKAIARLKAARLKQVVDGIIRNQKRNLTPNADAPMIILIGGSPGSGTTILFVRLAMHKWAIGVNESGVFGHPDIYCCFDRFSLNYINMIKSGTFKEMDEGERLRKGLSPHLLANSSRLEAHGLGINDVISLLQASKSSKHYLMNFLMSFFATSQPSARVLVEKTPSNIYALPDFLDGAPGRYGIAVVRDPIDLVSSLTNRGLPLFRAMAMWVVEAALALLIRDKLGGFVVRYEDFVRDPIETEKSLLATIGMPHGARHDSFPTSVDNWPSSWRSSPLRDVSAISIARGLHELDILDRMVFSNLVIKDFPGSRLDTFIGESAETIAKELGYQIGPEQIPDANRVRMRLRNLMERSLNTEPRIGRSNFYDRLVTCQINGR